MGRNFYARSGRHSDNRYIAMQGPNSSIFSANLAKLRRVDAALADRILAVTPADLAWTAARDGRLTASIEHQGRPLQLASRFDPLAEAAKLVSAADLTKHGGIAILGMGVGYHVEHLAKKIPKDAVLIVYEPSVAMLRAVFERVDHTSWLGRDNVVLVDRAIDRGDLISRIEHFAGSMTQGTVLITHPPTRQLADADVAAFGQMVTEALSYCRTNIATTLVNASRTIANQTQNLAHYLAGPNTNELHLAARGSPAICVGAGPSLAKNVDLLRDPDVRRNVVVVCAQTTLKPLLDRGIRPDIVTSLDYSEISRRFFESLPPLEDVTLVAEPKAHPAVFDSFPGPIRCSNDNFLDRMLGSLARPMVAIRHGATVAHLSVYVAQHLGCDPIILIGQDLGFSDGLYYCPGTAIHDVWAPELNAFNTLETLEWQRIVRHRQHLEKRTDVNGRPIYTDEQMLTYLGQFERDFSDAPQRIIDATEGGMLKLHTTRMTLSEALAKHATRPVPALPKAGRVLDAEKLRAGADLLRRRISETRDVRRIALDTTPLLRKILEHQRDEAKVNKCFAEIQRNKTRIDQVNETFELVNSLNTIGAFKRARADRAIENADVPEDERQRRQIVRDIENLEWLVQACDEALVIFQNAAKRLDGARLALATDRAASHSAGALAR